MHSSRHLVIITGIAIILLFIKLGAVSVFQVAEARNSQVPVEMMLSKDFVRLVIISTLIAWPIAWYGVTTWLQDFAYRVPVSWWVFAMAAGIALMIALVTVSFQAIKAAIANPVKSLRTE